MPLVSEPSPMKGKDPQREFYEELHANYVDERHIEAFADALNAEYFDNESPGTPRTSGPDLPSPSLAPTTPRTPALSVNGNAAKSPRIKKVTALSDFAPVNFRVKKRKKGEEHKDNKRTEWMFLILRWPLLTMIFLFIFIEFGLYILVRQCVNAKEWFSASFALGRGRKGLLMARLRAARTYDDWKAAADALDDYLGFNEWKAVDEDPLYDWRLVRKVLKSLRTLRKSGDARGVLGVLETCIRTNFAGIENGRLYSETFFGTKDLIEAYVTEVEKSLRFVRETTVLSNEEKRRFFKSSNTNLGISALCLSGGASFGYYHFGVVKAFVDANLLPRVVTGTSAGGLIAAFTCTRTDAELKRLLVPELADRITACEEPLSVWMKRFWKTGARFDSVDWARKCCFFTRGSLTFREAYQRTGRILNVSVIPADRHSPTKLLNYITAPDTVIWSALLASAAVPGILNPVVLMQKNKDGSLMPWNWGSKFKDGSLRVDIPLQGLNHYFNVTHPIVSQVNPHIHLFFFGPRGSAGNPVAHRKGKGWRGNFLLAAAEQWLKLELNKNFRVIRDLDLMPQILGQDWSSVFLQRFDGTITIWPKTRAIDFVNILTDPDREELTRLTSVGQSVTWPKLHMIDNRYRVEAEILRGRRAVRKASGHIQPKYTMLDEFSLENGHLPDAEFHPSMDSTTGDLTDGMLDSDVDAPFNIDKRVKRLQFEDEQRQASGTSTPDGLKASDDPLRSAARRKKWASQLLEDGEGSHLKDDYGLGSPDPANDEGAGLVQDNENGFLAGNILKRLRAKSFSKLSALRGKKGENEEAGWSSESSEDDDVDLHDHDDHEEHTYFEPISVEHDHHHDDTYLEPIPARSEDRDFREH